MKMEKAVVEYRDHPSGTKRCGECSMFTPPASCSYVKGKISPHGYCRNFQRKIGKVDHGR